jgi:ankyrin repeat protein
MRTVLYLLAVGLALVPAVVRADEIHDAARAGDVAKVKQLLAANPELVHAKTGVYTPLHYAAENGHDEIVLLLLDHGARVDEWEKDGCTPLHWAVISGHRSTAGLLLSRGANVHAAAGAKKITALHYAAWRGDLPMVELLICYGANVNAKSPSAGTPLNLAVVRGHSEVADTLRHAGAKE